MTSVIGSHGHCIGSIYKNRPALLLELCELVEEGHDNLRLKIINKMGYAFLMPA